MLPAIGGSATSTSVLNGLDRLTWVGPGGRSQARGLNQHPFYGVTFLGIAYGATTAASPSISLIPGTSQVQLFSTAEAGATMVFTT